MNDDLPKIAVIGTCRVHKPIEDLGDRGVISIHTGGLNFYVQSPGEIRKKISVLRNESEYVPDLFEFISDSDISKVPQGFDFNEADIIVIEVSSTKELELEGEFLQRDRIISKFIGNDEVRKKWWNGINRNESIGKRVRNIAEETPDGLNEIEENIFNKMTFKIMIKEDIKNSIRSIINLFARKDKILLVTHINTRLNGSGDFMARRIGGIAAIEEIASELGVRVFNPTAILEKIPQDILMENGGKDMHHYSKEMIGSVGEWLWEYHIIPMLDERI